MRTKGRTWILCFVLSWPYILFHEQYSGGEQQAEKCCLTSVLLKSVERLPMPPVRTGKGTRSKASSSFTSTCQETSMKSKQSSTGSGNQFRTGYTFKLCNEAPNQMSLRDSFILLKCSSRPQFCVSMNKGSLINLEIKGKLSLISIDEIKNIQEFYKYWRGGLRKYQ